jgi:hypothetical protein
MDTRSIVGPTLVGYFKTPQEARQCLLDLRTGGFGEDEIGYSVQPNACVVTVLPGDRWGDARRILARDGGELAAARPGSAIRLAVDRALRFRRH